MSVPFLGLELLEKKVIPNKQGEIRIRFGQAEAKPENLGEEGEITEEVEIKPRARPMAILDKRSTSTVNRQQILERLKKNNALTVKSELLMKRPYEIPADIPQPELLQPVAIKKRLVLKESGIKLVPKKQEVLEVETQGQEGKEREEEKDMPDEDVEAELKKMAQFVELQAPALTEEEFKEQRVEAAILESQEPKKAKKLRVKPGPAIVPEIDLTTVAIRSQKVSDRLPKEKEKVLIKAPTYYMNNRKLFIQKLTELFNPYRDDIIENAETASCDSSQSTEFDLLTHQKIVRDYLNLYTPYRGLLLYHGLGAGKTCTSIAIAEGMKSNKRVFVLTPASLKMNFFSEMKKCGDALYKKNQFWEFVSIDGNPEYVGVLARALSLSAEYIRKHRGGWLVNITKESNFTELSTEEQTAIDEQLNEMIRSKYTDINYNGMNRNKLNLLTGDMSRNPFDNSVVIIDEAHNFVSRIVNKIKVPDSISFILYDLLMKATNAKIVLLTGTPIINYPNEIGILFNILRGYIKSWTMTVTMKTAGKITTDTITDMLDRANLRTFDLVEYSGNKLTITRNPFGFINMKKTKKVAAFGAKVRKPVGTRKVVEERGGNAKTKKSYGGDERVEKPDEEYIEPDADVNTIFRQGMNFENNPYMGGSSQAFIDYDGVKLDESGNMSDTEFITRVIDILKKNGLDVPQATIQTNLFKALPDDSESFMKTFVNTDTEEAQNLNLLQRRILGLTSYFRSAQEQLLPRFVKTEAGDNYHVVRTEMTEYQFGLYEKIRKIEADKESSAKKRRRKQENNTDAAYTISSTYRIFSRAACNFVFPEGIERPVPVIKENKDITEATFDAIPIEERKIIDEYAPIGEEEDKQEVEQEITAENISTYAKRIEKAMSDVNVKEEGTEVSKYLTEEALEKISPKFAEILRNISAEENQGLHLLYSHFRTIEGIGILRLILLSNGFVEFKIKRTDDNQWQIEDADSEGNAGKPRFALYTGTETVEEKEIIRNVFNGMWDYVPATISSVLKKTSENNMYGEAIKLLMITSSGAEGINLRNTRFVHIVEPYWHMARLEQVIGRARRICSHQDLPEELRTVKVFLYISVLSEEQKTGDKHIALQIRDVSRMDKKTPVTTDESLYEIASMKQRINNQILMAVKQSAVDCNLYSANKNTEEQVVCYGFGKVESNQFISYPAFERDREEKEGLDVDVKRWKAVKVKIAGVDYAMNEQTSELYDYESYQRAARSGVEPILKGRLVNKRGRYDIEPA
jgi:hypothetical protein